MSTRKIEFENSEGLTLSARLDLPDHVKAEAFALFAHCFTCNKNLGAVRNISRALNSAGIGVLRFDFTGLGQSEGEFAETNFSTNVDDLVSAAQALEKTHRAPSIIIGHSLGGAAVIYAADQLDSIQAIATIGAPSSPQHVEHLFQSGMEEIKNTGDAEVSIGGRPFTIKKQFVEDLHRHDLKTVLGELRKPIVVFHSPQDAIVGIENAKELYNAARHPKSFVSLDGADHLLSNKEDSSYVGSVIAQWVTRYIEIPEKEVTSTRHQVAVSIGNEGFTSQVVAGKHLLVADEPEEYGGEDFGPSPYEYVSSGLGACTAMTMRMYADRKGWKINKIVVHINHGKDHCEDCKNLESGKKIDQFVREIEIEGDLSQEQIDKLMQIADKCPVHRTLSSSSVIKTSLK